MTMAIESSVSSGVKYSRADDTGASGGQLVSVSGQALPLLGTRLVAEARGGLARVTVQQRFGNPHAEPLRVSYLLPLPADGAVSGYRFTLGDRVIEGEVDRRVTARARFEQALMEGKTAALLEQARTALFTQEIGNLPPGAEVLVEVVVDQPLLWLTEGMWEWRFPTVVGPRFLGEPQRVPDAEAVSVDVARGPLRNPLEMSLRIGDAVTAGRAPESPSHALQTYRGEAHAQVQLESRDGVALDRDVVVRWPVARPEVGVSLALARPVRGELQGATFGLLTLVPPDVRPAQVMPRDLIFLIDVSGSMSGLPLDQVKRVVAALLETLEDHDRIELIAFSSEATRFRPEPVQAVWTARVEARRWLYGLRAGGSTEMVEATIEALKPLRAGAQRQVVLLTDGCIGFEEKLVRTVVDRLPRGSRLHVVGVGDGVNRSVTHAASRAGGGVEVLIGIDENAVEDVARVTARLLARTRAPLVTDLEIEGAARLAPRRLPDLYAGSPSLVAVELQEGCTSLRVKGMTASGMIDQTVAVEPLPLGGGHQAIVQRFGRELVEDLETTLSAGASARDVDRAVERAGLDFQIATRMTSWIAVTAERTVAPGPTRSQTQPHELVHGVTALGLGLRDAGEVADGKPVAPRMEERARAVDFQPRSGLVSSDGDDDQRSDATLMAAPPPSAYDRNAIDKLVSEDIAVEKKAEKASDRPAAPPARRAGAPSTSTSESLKVPAMKPGRPSVAGPAGQGVPSQEAQSRSAPSRGRQERAARTMGSRSPWVWVRLLLVLALLLVAAWVVLSKVFTLEASPTPAPQGQVQPPHGARE